MTNTPKYLASIDHANTTIAELQMQIDGLHYGLEGMGGEDRAETLRDMRKLQQRINAIRGQSRTRR